MKNTPAPALAHGLEILSIIVREKAIGFNKLKSITGINTNSLNRYLTTLCELNYISKTKDLKYSVGMNMCLFGNQVNVFQVIKEKARPYLKEIEQEFKVTALLMGISPNGIHCIDKVASMNNVSMQEVGSVVPGNIFSPWGILYLNTLDNKKVDILINTVYKDLYAELDKEKYQASMDFVKKNNYACNRILAKRTDLTGIKRIAFPIYNSSGELIASLAMGSFVVLLSEEKEKKLINKMREYSLILSKW